MRKDTIAMATSAPFVIVGSKAHRGALPIRRTASILGFLAATALVAAAAISSSRPDALPVNPILPTTTWLIGNPPVQDVLALETALTGEQRRAGLSGRTELAAGSGMVLVMPSARQTSFDASNLKIPIDLVYVGVDWRVHTIQRVEPGARPVGSRIKAVAAFQVAAGTAMENGLVPGAPVSRMASLDESAMSVVPERIEGP